MRQLIPVQVTVNAPVLRDRNRPRLLTHHHDECIALLREADRGAVPRSELRGKAAVLRQRQETARRNQTFAADHCGTVMERCIRDKYIHEKI